ncbi:MAG: MFS transporter [Chloroflexi bacterium]|nr:MFS transporter [Chloroflexota bacterium]
MRLFVEYVHQFGRFQHNARLYLINNVLTGVTTGILLVLYNLYLVSLGYGADFIGAVLFVGTLGAGLAIFPAGICVDRFSGKAILIYSNLLIGLAGIGQILFRQPLPLLASAFIAGIGFAFILVINAPFLTANSTPDERPQLFSLNIMLGLVTLVLGEVLGGALPGWFRASSWLMGSLPSWISFWLAHQPGPRSYQLALLFAGIISGPGLIPLFMMSKDRPQQVPTEARKAILQNPFPILKQWWQSIKVRTELRRLFHSGVFLLVLVWVCIGLAAGLYVPYFNIFFVQHLGASPALFGLVDGGANLITALLTLAAPWLALRVGRVNTMVWTRVISIPLLITIGLTNILSLAAILYLFRQGLSDMAVGILQVFSMEVVAKEHRGLANSSYQASNQVAAALTAPIGGLMIVHLGYPPVFLLGAFCLLLASGILWWKFGRGREKRQQIDDGAEPSQHVEEPSIRAQ